jgi:hypothetical protein
MWAETDCWNSGLGCAQNYGELKPVDGILVWDEHKIMASSNRLTEFWFVYVGITFCDSMWYAGVEANLCSVLFIVCVYCCWISKYQEGRAEIMLE